MNAEDRIKAYQKLFSSFTVYNGSVVQETIDKMKVIDEMVPPIESFFTLVNIPSSRFEFISKNIELNLGYSMDEIKEGGDIKFLLSKIHPKDVRVWLATIEELMNFVITKVPVKDRTRISCSYNYRIQKKNGDYITILEHTTPIYFDENHVPVIGLVHSTVANDNEKKYPIIGAIKIPNCGTEFETLFYKNFSFESIESNLSNRELDVLRLLALGNTSKEIGKKLCISPHTVDSHRRKLLKKMNFTSTGEIIQYYKENFIL